MKAIKGRGAQIQVENQFLAHQTGSYHAEGIDETDTETRTKYIVVRPKSIINKVKSPDLGEGYSLNLYQGCEHGCTYCYARNTHEYWGYNAGLDFEKVVLVKKDAPKLLRQELDKKHFRPGPVMLSGNTDCYQPYERKTGITRKILEVLREYGNPVSVITKNDLILRDIDILEDMARDNLIHVNISITTLDEEVRRLMEPRTATIKKRLNVIEQLSDRGIPVNVMAAPIIPGLNNHELFGIVKAAAARGARNAAYTMVRLNGMIPEVFEDWLRQHFPDRADKILNQVAHVHGGQLNDSRFGTRLTGEGELAASINRVFHAAKHKFMPHRSMGAFDLSHFRNRHNRQLSLFRAS